jgi:hypothetical protein
MNDEGSSSSRGPLTLKFTGVDDEATSDEEEEKEEEENNHIQTHTPDSVLVTRNGDTRNLTVNNGYGNNKSFFISK